MMRKDNFVLHESMTCGRIVGEAAAADTATCSDSDKNLLMLPTRTRHTSPWPVADVTGWSPTHTHTDGADNTNP